MSDQNQPQTPPGYAEIMADFARRDNELRRRKEELDQREGRLTQNPRQAPQASVDTNAQLLAEIRRLTARIDEVQGNVSLRSWKDQLPKDKFPLLSKSPRAFEIVEGMAQDARRSGQQPPSYEELAQQAESWLEAMGKDVFGYAPAKPAPASPAVPSAAPQAAQQPASPAELPNPGGPLAGPAATTIGSRLVGGESLLDPDVMAREIQDELARLRARGEA